MLSEGIATSRGRAGALLHRDAVGPQAARAARRAAGRADLGRRHPRQRQLRRGAGARRRRSSARVDEDFAIESMAGDVFLLGNTSWRIRRVEAGRVRVEDAARRSRRRSRSGSARARRARASCRPRSARCAPRSTSASPHRRGRRRLADAGVRARPARRRAGARLPGAPGARRWARCRRQTRVDRRALLRRGGRHAARAPRAVRRAHQPRLGHGAAQALLPLVRLRAAGGGHRRRHRAVARRAAQLPARDRVPDAARPRTSTSCSTQAALQAPMFETRWRWNAMRVAGAAALRRAGKPVPPPIQRMRAQDLLAAVFPGADRLPGQPRRRRHRDPGPPAGARDDARLPDRGDGRRGPARACWPTCAPARSRRSRARCPSRRCSRTRS